MTTIHKAKYKKPTNDKPNIYGMDFHINPKNIIRQFMKKFRKDINHVHILHKVSHIGTQTNEGKENTKLWNLINVTLLAMP